MQPMPEHTARARNIARVLDSAFRVPGTGFRFGLDPLLGLVPGVGDVVGGGFAAYLLWLAVRAGAPAPVLMRMGFNIVIDSLFGAIPFLGDLLDAGWKGNLRNLALLERHLADPTGARASSYVLLVGLVLLLAATIIGTIWVAFAAIRVLAGLIG